YMVFTVVLLSVTSVLSNPRDQEILISESETSVSERAKQPKTIRTFSHPVPKATPELPAPASRGPETPRLLVSGVSFVARWCGAHPIIVRTKELIWLNVRNGEQLRLLGVPPKGRDESEFYLELLACSPDGRWAIVQYAPLPGGNPS